ncbi:hypothetical protein CSOJ01_01803 [Colletotrichum sojae]|uniref:Uncharacterized protein n=1 Tax=Colletotrichum sojae TaxID=2175907 RepID=A0A8H6JTB9_9PEZI|nr:hypothetical protein CSOJ01_01803 [Colletotrichum sojae]
MEAHSRAPGHGNVKEETTRRQQPMVGNRTCPGSIAYPYLSFFVSSPARDESPRSQACESPELGTIRAALRPGDATPLWLNLFLRSSSCRPSAGTDRHRNEREKRSPRQAANQANPSTGSPGFPKVLQERGGRNDIAVSSNSLCRFSFVTFRSLGRRSISTQETSEEALLCRQTLAAATEGLKSVCAVLGQPLRRSSTGQSVGLMGGNDVTASIGNYRHLSIKGRQCEFTLDETQRDSDSLEDQFTYPGRLSTSYS